VISTEPIEICAWLDDSRHGLFQLRAEILQGGSVKVRANSKFMAHG
jgi:hypothetical protein